MSAQDGFEDDLLELILTNAAAPNVGDAGGLQPSAGAGSWHVSLLTAAPAESVADQTTNEPSFTPYARQAVARSGSGWTVASGVGDNDSAISFDEVTTGSGTITNFGLGFASTSTGDLKMVGALTSPSSLAVSAGIAPEFAAGDLDVSLD